jgi:hypothetical protein
MKKVIIRMKGSMVAFIGAQLTCDELNRETVHSYSYISELDDDGFIDNDTCTWLVFLKTLDVLTYSENKGEHIVITKNKGKYINTDSYFKETLGTNERFVFQPVTEDKDLFVYTIELEDDEEFDPKKLQLVNSAYEVNFLPYGIIVDYIMYDGKKIYTDSYYEYEEEHKACYLYTGPDDWPVGHQW